MPTPDEIRYNADRIEDDADTLRDAIMALLARGTQPTSRLIKDIAQRRDEWQAQADEMRRRANEEV